MNDYERMSKLNDKQTPEFIKWVQKNKDWTKDTTEDEWNSWIDEFIKMKGIKGV